MLFQKIHYQMVKSKHALFKNFLGFNFHLEVKDILIMALIKFNLRRVAKAVRKF